ncbi:zinc finger protein 181-like [Megalops cyprinoides]|uniref:zinc finger protein 181-like n=1 Tax=Megalops cyprinoides TaxID=118141 RepID=UPI0018651734|nr:zinc finger protein 181-like [Megalops cyprinoides]
MTTDIDASLCVSLDLSSVVEEALRSAVCSVLNEIQRLIGRDVAELRAAVARKDCENEKLRAQLELARRELRERADFPKKSVLNSDVSSPCNEHESGHTSTCHHSMHSNADEDPSSLDLEQSSSVWNQHWDSDTGSDIQHNFPDPLEDIETKPDFTGHADYSLDAAESDNEPNPSTEAPDMIQDAESMRTDPSLAYTERNPSGLDDAHTAKELRVVQVKEELPAGPASSTAPGLPHPSKSKPYICGECGKSYLWLKSLKKHQKIHSGEAPFSCSICCKHFSSQQLFDEHQRVHTSLRPHRCADCPKTFSHLSNLKKHQLIHTGEKPHHCSLCGKRFRQIQHLKEHRKTHEDSKPFRCGECGWGFNHGSNFKRHLLVHTRQKMRHGLGS